MEKFDDHRWMEAALVLAERAGKRGEVPVGAVVVYDGKMVAKAHNLVEFSKDATAHAECLALRKASFKLKRWRLIGCTLYSTLEPCAMCLGAMLLARIDRLVWGARDVRHGANGSFIDLLKFSHPTHSLCVTKSILADASSSLMKNFFRLRR